MARKLFIMMALIGLALLVQAAPGLATLYSLSQLGNDSVWTWREARVKDPPGSDPTYFVAGNAYASSIQEWSIPRLINDPAQTSYTRVDDYWTNVKIVYTTPQNPGDPVFTATIQGGPTIISYDTTITTSAIYKKATNSDKPLYVSSYIIQNQTFNLVGSGTNADDHNTPFTFTAILHETYGDHTHYGYFDNFSITYPTAAAAPTPIPGAVWLLGSGLLGLACLRPRLRKK